MATFIRARNLSDAAGRAATAITDWPSRAVVSYMVAVVKARIGDAQGLAMAVDAIGAAPESMAAFYAAWLRSQGQLWLVEAQTRAGNVEQAFATTDRIDAASWRIEALLVIAGALPD